MTQDWEGWRDDVRLEITQDPAEMRGTHQIAVATVSTQPTHRWEKRIKICAAEVVQMFAEASNTTAMYPQVPLNETHKVISVCMFHHTSNVIWLDEDPFVCGIPLRDLDLFVVEAIRQYLTTQSMFHYKWAMVSHHTLGEPGHLIVFEGAESD